MNKINKNLKGTKCNKMKPKSSVLSIPLFVLHSGSLCRWSSKGTGRDNGQLPNSPQEAHQGVTTKNLESKEFSK